MAKPRRKKTGLAPGTLLFTGKKYLDTPLLKVIKYDEATAEEVHPDSQETATQQTGKRYWYDLRGVHEREWIERIGKDFQMHPLVLEDIMDPEQRPKLEEYDQGIFIILRALSFHPEKLKLETEQLGIYIGQDFVWTFQEKADDLFAAIRDRFSKPQTRLRKLGSDYLGYALIDAVVDHYYVVLDDVERAIDQLENEILENSSSKNKAEIHQFRLQSAWMRKNITPLREAISRFSRLEHPLIKPETQLYIRDLYDHVIQVMDLVETYRDIINGLYELYQSELSMKMNNIMQTLTIISTIFIPLGFLAGVYGMNFEQMPELKSTWGYYIWWTVVVLLVMGMLYLFRRRKWL